MIDRRAVVERYFAAINAENWESLADLFEEDAELRFPFSVGTRGPKEIVAHFRRALGHFSYHRDDPRRIVMDGPVLFAEIGFEGTTIEGIRLEFEAVDIFDIPEDRISRLRTFFDSYRYLRMVQEARR